MDLEHSSIVCDRSRRSSRRFMRRTLRELAICVAIPAVLMISGAVIAQKSDSGQHSDQEISAAIQSKLTPTFGNPLPFTVTVQNGAVTVTGNIASVAQRQQVDDAIRGVPGVQGIIDQLNVGGGTSSTGNTTGTESQSSEPSPGPPPPPPAQSEQSPQSQPSPPSGTPAQPPVVTVATGTPIYALMLQAVGSKHTQPGERFRGVVAQDVILQNGIIAIPRGAVLDGVVVDARPPGHLKGRPKLALQLLNVEMGGRSYPLTSSIWDHEGPGKGGQTAGTVVGTTGAGAVIGGIAGGGSGALLGSVIGGLGGLGISSLNRGPQLFVPAESVLTFYVEAPLTVQEPTRGEIQSLAGNIPYGYAHRPPPPRPYYPYPYRPGYYPPPPPPGGPPGGYPY